MEIFYILVLAVGLVAIALYLNRKLNEFSDKQKPSSELLEYLKTTNQRLDQQGKAFNERLDAAARVIGSVQRNIGEMSEIGRGMRELQDFLKNPKLRGNIGEQVLNELLKQYLPKESLRS